MVFPCLASCHTAPCTFLHSLSVSLVGRTFGPLHYLQMSEVIEQFVFSLNNISLYGVIHSFTSKCYLCGEVSQTPTLAHLSPLASRLISVPSLKWFSFILVLIHFLFGCHWLYVEARLVFLHSLLLCGKDVKKYATIKTTAYIFIPS